MSLFTLLAGRGRQIALAASVIAAMVFAAAAAGRGCGPDDDRPEGAVRAFVAAANTGDAQAIFELLGPRTQARLEAAASRATDLAGAAQRFGPHDMLRLKPGGEAASAPKDYRVVERTDDRAWVEVVGRDGSSSRFEVVRVDGLWRVELPTLSPEM